MVSNPSSVDPKGPKVEYQIESILGANGVADRVSVVSELAAVSSFDICAVEGPWTNLSHLSL